MGLLQEIEDKQRLHKEFTEYVAYLTELSNEHYEGVERVKEFCELRGFSYETALEHNIFYIKEPLQMIPPEFMNLVYDFGVISATNKKPIFTRRIVMPIKDINGDVQNLVGYSPDAHERYIYGTGKYYERTNTLFGLENMNLAYEMGYAIWVEGITDAMRLRDLGYKNSFANCGTHSSEFISTMFNRCRHGVIKIPDRDFAGKRAVEKWHTHRSITLNVPVDFKDIDEMCVDTKEIDWVHKYMKYCIEWVTSDTHKNTKSCNTQVTIV